MDKDMKCNPEGCELKEEAARDGTKHIMAEEKRMIAEICGLMECSNFHVLNNREVEFMNSIKLLDPTTLSSKQFKILYRIYGKVENS